MLNQRAPNPGRHSGGGDISAESGRTKKKWPGREAGMVEGGGHRTLEAGVGRVRVYVGQADG